MKKPRRLVKKPAALLCGSEEYADVRRRFLAAEDCHFGRDKPLRLAKLSSARPCRSVLTC